MRSSRMEGSEQNNYDTCIQNIVRYKRLYNKNFLKRIEIIKNKVRYTPKQYDRKMKYYTKKLLGYSTLLNSMNLHNFENPYQNEIFNFN